MYTALLRLPGSMSRADKMARVDEVVQQLGLIDCKHTRIGNAFMRGVSGGERKRASIGIEIIVNPRILFLDEPTSGLDSYTAYHIMQTIRTLTMSGRSVICSIHQPREKIYHVSTTATALALAHSPHLAALATPCGRPHVLTPTPARLSKPRVAFRQNSPAFAGQDLLLWQDQRGHHLL